MATLNTPTEVLSGDIDFSIAYSLVDISNTGYSNPKGNTLEYQQAQNLNTILQILGMRTQIVLSSVTILEDQDLSNYKFGSDYAGKHTVWVLKFASEKSGAWDRGATEMFYAYKDCHLTPIHADLNETAPIEYTFITTSTPTRNLYFENSKSL